MCVSADVASKLLLIFKHTIYCVTTYLSLSLSLSLSLLDVVSLLLLIFKHTIYCVTYISLSPLLRLRISHLSIVIPVFRMFSSKHAFKKIVPQSRVVPWLEAEPPLAKVPPKKRLLSTRTLLRYNICFDFCDPLELHQLFICLFNSETNARRSANR